MLVEHTPMRQVQNVFVKLEAFNQGGSHKSRAARHIIQSAIDSGELRPGCKRRILEKSGGNLGVGLAFEAAKFGIGVDLVVGLSFSRIKKALCAEYGARIIGTDLLLAGLSPREVIQSTLEKKGDAYFFTDQFNNPANLHAHTVETGPELAAQIASSIGKIDRPIILVKGAGTGASFQGIALALRERFQNVRCELVMPAECDYHSNIFHDHKLEGFAVGVRPPFLDPAQIDGIVRVTATEAHQGQKAMAHDLGFFPGKSSGANYVAAQRLAHCNPDATVVTVAYDNGESYLSELRLETTSGVLAYA